MSTIAPLPMCPICHGTGKVGAEFCVCLERNDESGEREDDAPGFCE